MVLLGARDLGEFGDVFDRGLGKFLCDDRQQALAHAIAKEGEVLIGRILTPGLAPFAQKILQCGAAKAQQWPHQFAKRAPLLLEYDLGMNARKSPNSGTAKNAQQDCLRLIVESVGRGNLRDATLASELAKKTVTQIARGGFYAGTVLPLNWRFLYMEFEPVLTGQFCDKPFVLVRLISAQLVIDVRNREHDAQFRPQLQQQAKQGHGIRATGNGHREAVSGANRIVFPN